MPTRTFVEIPRPVYDHITRWAEQAYPHEGCGLLIGRFEKDGAKRVVGLTSLKNKLLEGAVAVTLPPERQNRPEIGFSFDPAEFNDATLAAEKEGLDVVGIIHTHPDHPPRPSQIDASQPFLAFYSVVIVSVQKGKTAEMKSWFRDADDKPFEEEPLQIS